MSASSVRLAVVGCPADVGLWQDIAARLSDGCIVHLGDSIIGDSVGSVVDRHQDEFDAIVICNPLDNERAIHLAIKAEKHVLIASPLADTRSGADSIIEACQEAGVRFAVCDTLRFHPSSQAIMDRLTDGKLGDPGLLRVHRWRVQQETPLAEWLFPDVDLAMALFGSKPSDIYAIHRRGSIDAPKYVQIHFGFPAGGMAVMDFSGTLSGDSAYDSLSLIGSRGAAYADDHWNTHLLYHCCISSMRRVRTNYR